MNCNNKQQCVHPVPSEALKNRVSELLKTLDLAHAIDDVFGNLFCTPLGWFSGNTENKTTLLSPGMVEFADILKALDESDPQTYVKLYTHPAVSENFSEELVSEIKSIAYPVCKCGTDAPTNTNKKVEDIVNEYINEYSLCTMVTVDPYNFLYNFCNWIINKQQ